MTAVKSHLHAMQAVNGEYTAYGALCKLLEGTGLSFRYGLPGESEPTYSWIADRKWPWKGLKSSFCALMANYFAR